jgi:serine/threonine protein kinase/tetratricopeptide (TPR) repeat protein
VDPLLWKRIGELFAAARLLNGESRIAFLKENCDQNRDLFEQVMFLLDADRKTAPLDSAPTISSLPAPHVIAGRFRIIRYIAEGGMGTVYEAQDLRLNDRVALKTIRPDIAMNPRAVERFKREILLAKKVTHPNVCRVHDLGVDRSETGAEFLFLTMQFLSGETLASRIKRGPILKTDAFPLIEDMADALSAAHHADVIHRDFKSGNVMLVNGADRTCAVVTDFGLASGIHDSRSLTHAGIVGTVDYMAPEQIKGDEITPAADIYALGVVMYEMVTGQRPFTDDSTVTLALKHLNDEPPPPGDLAPNLDPNWAATILRCLRKLPHERFQSAAEVKAALVQNRSRSPSRLLRRPSKRTNPGMLIAISVGGVALVLGAVPPVRKTVVEWLRFGSVPHSGQVAILPFTVPGDDPQSSALEYGLADTLATRLTQVAGNRTLQVVPASEIRAKGITSLEQARQEFGVNLGLELSLQRSGQMVRVNYALVDAKTHRQLKGDTITAPSTDGFAIEDKVADSVARALNFDLQPQEKQLLATHGTSEPAAYDYYLEGRGYIQEFQKPENIESAITVFHRALDKDPQFSLAYSGLGEAYWHKYKLTHEKQWADDAQRSCETSVRLDSNSASAHACLGLVYEGTGKYEEAVKEYQVAIAREPANDDAIRGLASAYQRLRKINDAEATYHSAIGARPNYWENYNALGIFYFAQGRYSQAVEMFTRVTDLAPDSFRGYSNLGAALLQLGRNDDAIRAFRHSIEIRPTYDAFSNLATAHFRLRQYDDAAYNYSRALALDDKDYLVWGNLGESYYYSITSRSRAASVYEKAISIAMKNLEINPRDASVHGDLAGYYSMIGKRDEALHNLSDSLVLSAEKDPALLYQAALVYNQLGQTNMSITYLSKAIAAGYSVSNISNAQALSNLHARPQYQALIQQNNVVPKSP